MKKRKNTDVLSTGQESCCRYHPPWKSVNKHAQHLNDETDATAAPAGTGLVHGAPRLRGLCAWEQRLLSPRAGPGDQTAAHGPASSALGAFRHFQAQWSSSRDHLSAVQCGNSTGAAVSFCRRVGRRVPGPLLLVLSWNRSCSTIRVAAAPLAQAQACASRIRPLSSIFQRH
uniref:Uncharacterized protein n=1 Tax=Rousettus aegyptiacus TaxID=9407 RepID=A0A7J8GBB9_ROUAE|nr:hypothetical protein HJG63_011583 [Rousettus aegyptiacus]